MMYIIQALAFLIDVIFGLYILVLMLRFLLQWMRVEPYHPVSHFLLMFTNPVLKPMKRFIPDWGRLNSAALLLMLVLQFCKRLLTHSLLGGIPGVLGLLILAVADLIQLLIYVFIFSILIQAVLSWVRLAQSDGYYHSSDLDRFLFRLNEPILGPIRRLVPPAGGMDFSSLIAIVGLYLLVFLLVGPLMSLGMYL